MTQPTAVQLRELVAKILAEEISVEPESRDDWGYVHPATIIGVDKATNRIVKSIAAAEAAPYPPKFGRDGDETTDAADLLAASEPAPEPQGGGDATLEYRVGRIVEQWELDILGPVEALIKVKSALDEAALTPKPSTPQAESVPAACVVCSETDPHTGACGSTDPRALCNRESVPVVGGEAVKVLRDWLRGDNVQTEAFTTAIRAAIAAMSHPAPQADGEGEIPEAVEIKHAGLTGGVARAGDWAIDKGNGCIRIVDERFALGWNACRELRIAASKAPAEVKA